MKHVQLQESPKPLCNMFKLSTRNGYNFINKKHKSTLYNNSFLNVGITAWNKQTKEVKEINVVKSYTKYLKRACIGKY